MPERDEYSPSEQTIFEPNWRQAFMLRRISRVALWLPGEFDRSGKGGKLHVSGRASQYHTVINLEEFLADEGDHVTRFTDITLDRSSADPNLLTGLEADARVSDDIGVLTGVSSEHKTFSLGGEDSGLSMFNVMRSVNLAAHTVAYAETLDYLSSAPETGFTQTL